MISKQIKLTNAEGLHMRPAGSFASAMSKYKCDVTITFNDRQINAKSIMSILTACIKSGSVITVTCNGDDENEALSEAISIIESEFTKN